MAAKTDKAELTEFWNNRLVELLQMRDLPEDDLSYLLHKVEALKDERLKSCIAGLLGWGDEERAEMHTFCAIALETMSLAKPSLIREASRIVEIKAHIKNSKRN